MRRVHLLIACYFVLLTCVAQTVVTHRVYKSTIENLDNPIILYRGWANKLHISYPGADSISVAGAVVKSVDSIDVYNISPGGLENDIVITAWMPDGSIRKETRKAMVKNLTQPRVLLNGMHGSLALQTSQVRGAKVQVAMPDGPPSITFSVMGFTVTVNRNRGKNKVESVVVNGDVFDEVATRLIEHLRPGDVFFIHQVKLKGDQSDVCILPTPISVTIIPKTK